MTRQLTAAVVALVYAASGRHVDETVLDAWQFLLDDVADGPDVMPLVRRLTRDRGGFVRADEVWQAVNAERERAALRDEYRPPPTATAELEEQSPPVWDGPGPAPEDPAEWMAHVRERLRSARGPLAATLSRVVSMARADETYFEPSPPDPEPGSFS